MQAIQQRVGAAGATLTPCASRDYSADTRSDDRYLRAFRGHLRGQSLDETQVATLRAGLPGVDTRALGIGSGGAGGYTVAPEFHQMVIAAMRELGGIREAGATILRTHNGAPLPIPSTSDTEEGEQHDENEEVDEGESLLFGQHTLLGFTYTSGLVLVPNQLVQDAGVDFEQFLADRLAARVGRITNRKFTTGSGDGEPQGVVTAAAEGAVGGAGQETSVTYADLVRLKHSVDPAYRRRARWMFNGATFELLEELRDDDGNPVVQYQGSRELILGHPFTINQHVPSMGPGARSILFGDFGKYHVRDVAGAGLVILRETTGSAFQTGFIWWSRHDGRLVNAGTNPVKYYQNTPAE